jgi:hypothetical protein
MRHNSSKNLNVPPSSLLNATLDQERIALTRNLDGIDTNIYKGSKIVISDIVDPYYNQEEFENRYVLRRLFYNKCAYCEKYEFKPDVEHFRPKKGVTNPNGNKHGYYWLCYNWSNLLPACSNCNSGQGKWNKFPVLGLRIVNPPISNGSLLKEHCNLNCSLLLEELPKLLNPEIDNPENFIRLKWNGYFEGIDGGTGVKNDPNNGRGWTSIICYDLNRGNLIFGRKKAIDNLTKLFEKAFALFRENSNVESLIFLLLKGYETLDNMRSPTCEFSFVLEYIFNHFENYVNECFNNLKLVEKKLLKQEFLKYQNSI